MQLRRDVGRKEHNLNVGELQSCDGVRWRVIEQKQHVLILVLHVPVESLEPALENQAVHPCILEVLVAQVKLNGKPLAGTPRAQRGADEQRLALVAAVGVDSEGDCYSRLGLLVPLTARAAIILSGASS